MTGKSGDNPAFVDDFSACEETTYSFDYDNAHFVVLNVYCDENSDIDTSADGEISDHLYDWLVLDLEATTKP